MRTDYVLYVVALICFVVAGVTVAAQFTEATANALIAIVLAIIGVIFAWGGYSLRPQPSVATPVKPSLPPTPPAVEEQPAPPLPEPEPEPTPAAAPPEKIEEMPPSEAAPISPAEAPPETATETMQETKKPARKRRERKKT